MRAGGCISHRVTACRIVAAELCIAKQRAEVGAMEAAVLQHLLGSARGSGSAGAAAAFEAAASQLQLLGGQAWRSGQAGELAEELLDKAEQLIGSKQVRGGCQS